MKRDLRIVPTQMTDPFNVAVNVYCVCERFSVMHYGPVLFEGSAKDCVRFIEENTRNQDE